MPQKGKIQKGGEERMTEKKKSSPVKEKSSTKKASSGRTKKQAPPPAKVPEKGGRLSPALDVYVVDSGWEGLGHRILTKSIGIMKRFLTSHKLFVMSQDQSDAFLKRHPSYIGRDPLLVVVDPGARLRNSKSGFGTVLVLGDYHWVVGRSKNPQLSEIQFQTLIKMFLRIINSNEGSTEIADDFRNHNHQVGVKGTLEIVMDSLGQEALHLGEEG